MDTRRLIAYTLWQRGKVTRCGMVFLNVGDSLVNALYRDIKEIETDDTVRIVWEVI